MFDMECGVLCLIAVLCILLNHLTMKKIIWRFTWNLDSGRYYDTPEEAIMAIKAGSDVVTEVGTLHPLFAVKMGDSDIMYKIKIADAYTYNYRYKKWLSEPCMPI